MTRIEIAIIPGDGIGLEIMECCTNVLDALQDRYSDFQLSYNKIEAGAQYFKKTGFDISDQSFVELRRADAILLGAIGLPSIRHNDGTEIAPHLRIRTELDLYAGLRPIKFYPNIPITLADPRTKNIDIIIVRESTEGLFASLGKSVIENDKVARETMEITRNVCERLFDATFVLARKRKGQGGKGLVTCVDKANVFPAMAFFRKIFNERAKLNPDITVNYRYVDAAALELVKCPWDFDVMVMENMFGDILSDLGAGIIGSMGFAPCGEIGDMHGLFQPAHGSAPDIAGQNKANPIAMFVSAGMMLDWLGEKKKIIGCSLAAADLVNTIEKLFLERKILPFEVGGNDSTTGISEKIIQCLK